MKLKRLAKFIISYNFGDMARKFLQATVKCPATSEMYLGFHTVRQVVSRLRHDHVLQWLATEGTGVFDTAPEG